MVDIITAILVAGKCVFSVYIMVLNDIEVFQGGIF